MSQTKQIQFFLLQKERNSLHIFNSRIGLFQRQIFASFKVDFSRIQGKAVGTYDKMSFPFHLTSQMISSDSTPRGF